MCDSVDARPAALRFAGAPGRGRDPAARGRRLGPGSAINCTSGTSVARAGCYACVRIRSRRRRPRAPARAPPCRAARRRRAAARGTARLERRERQIERRARVWHGKMSARAGVEMQHVTERAASGHFKQRSAPQRTLRARLTFEDRASHASQAQHTWPHPPASHLSGKSPPYRHRSLPASCPHL